jgi:hypothetical protein
MSSCAVPLSEQLAGKKIPVAPQPQLVDAAEIIFSADKKYETAKGVPFSGDPLTCTAGKIYRVNQGDLKPNKINVKAGEEVSVTSVIAWVNTGFRKVCGPFVRFTPEQGATYVVVNERIGGKGVSALWTGMAFQTCEVSVYRETSTGFTRVPAQKVEAGACRVPEV